MRDNMLIIGKIHFIYRIIGKRIIKKLTAII